MSLTVLGQMDAYVLYELWARRGQGIGNAATARDLLAIMEKRDGKPDGLSHSAIKRSCADLSRDGRALKAATPGRAKPGKRASGYRFNEEAVIHSRTSAEIVMLLYHRKLEFSTEEVSFAERVDQHLKELNEPEPIGRIQDRINDCIARGYIERREKEGKRSLAVIYERVDAEFLFLEMIRLSESRTDKKPVTGVSDGQGPDSKAKTSGG
jgi:hypothetical protein